jgi:ADP-ribosylglycohydrolase
MPKLPPQYEEKVYAGWLGKCIGVRFGAPVENWTYHQIRDYIGTLDKYLPLAEGKVFQPDDDTSVPMILLRAIEDYGENVQADDIAKTLLNYIGDQHGTFWWGGYGISTEHTAYLNIKNGINPPLSGSIELNGATVAEQIGGQIFSDIWGLLIPGNIKKAADFARKASSVTHDRNGIYGGMFIAALVSAAFYCKEPVVLINEALKVIPEDSVYAQMVCQVLGYYQTNPSEWRACYDFIDKRFGYDKFSGIVHIIPNAAIIVMGLLYGGSDFSRTLQITNMAGWDTDCNVGNVGAVMGVAVGIEGIPDYWRLSQNDMFTASGLIGSANIIDIPNAASRIVSMGKKISGEPLFMEKKRRYDFEFPGATHGFRFEGDQRNILDIQQLNFEDRGSLKGIVRLLKKKQDMSLFVDTYFHPKDLQSSFYASGFSPTIFPGQSLEARICIPKDGPESILVGLFVYDDEAEVYHQGPSINLVPGVWQTLNWKLPHLYNACIGKVGLRFRNLSSDLWRGIFFLDYLEWQGRPSFTQELSHLNMEYGGAEGWTYHRGYWRVEDDGYHGSGVEINESYTGDLYWSDVDLDLTLKPLIGDLHGLLFRVKGALHSYAAALIPGKLALFKKENGKFTEVTSIEFNWKYNQRYQIIVNVHDATIKVKLEDVTLEWTDQELPYLTGQIGLLCGANSHTCFEMIHVS